MDVVGHDFGFDQFEAFVVADLLEDGPEPVCGRTRETLLPVLRDEHYVVVEFIDSVTGALHHACIPQLA